MITFQELVESEAWRSTSAKIPLALGQVADGKPLIADLAEMPHLLIAGTTGSGKSICLHSIIASLRHRFTPAQLRFVLIDPKGAEFQPYGSAPHLALPIAVAPKDAILALRWVVYQMEERYERFAQAGVRNIEAFNTRSADKLGYLVVIIDELAELVLSAPEDIQIAITRLTQMARATGIYCVIATQRPSVGVIKGVVKANVPTRIAFQVASKMDSRVILDAPGAERLLGKGDMFYRSPGACGLVRAQGAFVDQN